MNAIHALHDAVRRYCIDGFEERYGRYDRLMESGRATARPGVRSSGQSAEAFDAFPRYQILAAILHEVERLTPGDFTSVDEARHLLAAAGKTVSMPSNLPVHPIVIAAVGEERRRFVAFVRSVDPEAIRTVSPLPFRRVLGSQERDLLHHAFIRCWGRWYGGYAEDGDAAPTVTLHEAVLDGDESPADLRAALTDRGVTRLFELREFGEEQFELDVSAASFIYNGAEGFWTSDGMDWMVYSSHQSSITFGGSWLIDRMRAVLPDFERYLYKGWDLAAYDTD